VVKAIKARRPRLRYATTIDARLLPLARRLLGDKLFDKAVLSQLK
jgi:hypothetical protein